MVVKLMTHFIGEFSMLHKGPKQIAKEHWNKEFAKYANSEIVYDNWLDSCERELQSCVTPIIDLGCGAGNNTKYLLEKGKEVIPCDFAETAIVNIKSRFPQIKQAECFDMTKGLPFADNFTDLVIADLSLHYFSEDTTYDILEEIQRVLKPNGFLCFRVNSVKDKNHGAGQGTEIAKHLYETADGRQKRFFDKNDIETFWQAWHLVFYQEENMHRYELNKVLWRCLAQKVL
jgi:SAM-dependent methyltransferase